MTNYGEIVIKAKTIEEAEKDLEMIKALAEMGAVCGSGSGVSGKAEAIISAPQKPCCCGCCKCNEEEEDESLVDEIYSVLEKVEDGYYSPYTALQIISSIIETL